MMCDCAEKIRKQLLAALPDATDIELPIELISGQFYLTAKQVTIKNGQPRRKDVVVLLEHCPGCGRKYEREAR